MFSTHPVRQPTRMTRSLAAKPLLLFAFAFAVMADPVSSVAYAVEAALRALGGDLSLLVPTMALVVAVIALVIVNYHQLVARYPNGGGASAAIGEAFGEAWAFIPIGALIVDFVLTIAISVSAGASAVIAYYPALAAWRVALALGLVLFVAALTWFGHLGRLLFAVLTVAFIVIAVWVIIDGMFATPVPTGEITQHTAQPPVLAVVLAFPVAMALATGAEAPSSAIAQLGQLDDRDRRRFGRTTLWLTLGIVGAITLGIAIVATRLQIGIPAPEQTQIANLARVATSPPVYAAFQLVTALLLLSAASSSFQAGPGLLKALARATRHDGYETGILPRPLGHVNTHHTPFWGVVVFLLLSAGITVVAGGDDQELVLFYAVSVFLSFLAGLTAMAVFAARERRPVVLILNVVGAIAVAFTLVMDLARIDPIASLIAALAIAGVLYVMWVRAGRPAGIRNITAEAEQVTDA
jgi:amino acid transporter